MKILISDFLNAMKKFGKNTETEREKEKESMENIQNESEEICEIENFPLSEKFIYDQEAPK